LFFLGADDRIFFVGGAGDLHGGGDASVPTPLSPYGGHGCRFFWDGFLLGRVRFQFFMRGHHEPS
jgi:hypothetical protein